MSNKLKHIEDQILVMDAQDGDNRAMEKLVTRYQKRLWSHACRLVGNSDAAWDITQQSWMGIIKGLRKLNDPAGFKAWAYRITTNKAIDWIKRKKKQKNISFEETYCSRRDVHTDTGIKELLNKLDPAKRAVISLHYFDQLSVGQISTVLKIPAGTVKSRLHNARKELKKIWQQSCR